ncbi:MAG: acyl-CoA dehydrogenase [Sandaracinaceae bacterium]|nr:acyl-CoA dehydrogenase [Sandaracinaceae bacterium]
MHFELTEEQRMIQSMARDFAEREVAPKARELDRTGRWPSELVKRMGELGLMGLVVPEEYGGSGADTVSYALAMEEISRACASTGVIMSVQNSLVCEPLLRFGNEEQKRRFLVPLARGEKLGCFGLTEPASGSDAAHMATIAEDRGEHFILNGAKNWITNGPHADLIIVFAAFDPSLGAKGTVALIVERGTPGFTQAPPDEKMGIHAAHSCTVFFDNVKVPRENMLGEKGMGFKIAMITLDGGRIGIAAQAIGIARAAFEKALEYAKVRKAFGEVIANKQAIQFMLADMATELDAARLLTLRAAWMKDKGMRHTRESSMAKLFASEAATRITHKAIQIHGGYGYSTEYDVERHYRDARITEIYEGTSEIQRLVIATQTLKS